MMTKEEVGSIVLYYKERNISFKSRLEELGIAPWRFYEAKYKYGKEQSDVFFAIGSLGTFIPCTDLNRHTKRGADCSTAPARVNIELQTNTGVIMRIQGDLDKCSASEYHPIRYRSCLVWGIVIGICFLVSLPICVRVSTP